MSVAGSLLLLLLLLQPSPPPPLSSGMIDCCAGLFRHLYAVRGGGGGKKPAMCSQNRATAEHTYCTPEAKDQAEGIGGGGGRKIINSKKGADLDYFLGPDSVPVFSFTGFSPTIFAC